MQQEKRTDINIIVSDGTNVNRQTAVNILKGFGYADSEITEIEIAQSTNYDAATCGGGGVNDAPTTAKYVYIGKS